MDSCAFVTLFLIISLFSNSNADEYLHHNSTWSGAPDGFGTDSGACGYGGDVGTRPFDKFVAAGHPIIFKDGLGCGWCFELKCHSHTACSGVPVKVTITDLVVSGDDYFFDLSGHAFGAMAYPGKADELRNAGKIKIDYRKAACDYHGVNITFKIDPASTPTYFLVTPEYLNGQGMIYGLEIRNKFQDYIKMEHSHGATWKVNSTDGPLDGPLTFRILSLGWQTAFYVIPDGWKPGQSYQSTVNFSPDFI